MCPNKPSEKPPPLVPASHPEGVNTLQGLANNDGRRLSRMPYFLARVRFDCNLCQKKRILNAQVREAAPKIRAIRRDRVNLRGTTNASGWGWCYPECCG
jgi:hypothetical protein